MSRSRRSPRSSTRRKCSSPADPLRRSAIAQASDSRAGHRRSVRLADYESGSMTASVSASIPTSLPFAHDRVLDLV
jgi:hypothetical protein